MNCAVARFGFNNFTTKFTGDGLFKATVCNVQRSSRFDSFELIQSQEGFRRPSLLVEPLQNTMFNRFRNWWAQSQSHTNRDAEGVTTGVLKLPKRELVRPFSPLKGR